MGYREDIARYQAQVNAMRQQKAQAEYVESYNQAINGREESLKNRQEVERQFALTSDPAEQQSLKDEWHMYDGEVQQCEQTIREMTPQQANPHEVAYLQRRAPFLERTGNAGARAMDLANQYVTGRMGLRPGTR